MDTDQSQRLRIDANGKGNGLQNVVSFCFEPAWRVGVHFEPDLEILCGIQIAEQLLSGLNHNQLTP